MKRKQYNCSECGKKVTGVVYGDSSIVYGSKEQSNIVGELNPDKRIKVCVEHSDNIEQPEIPKEEKEEEPSEVKENGILEKLESLKDYTNSLSALLTENRNRIVELENRLNRICGVVDKHEGKNE